MAILNALDVDVAVTGYFLWYHLRVCSSLVSQEITTLTMVRWPCWYHIM
jgi:hypothetical protein